jgi:hypothetical protein
MFRSIITHRGIDIPLAQSVESSASESSWKSFYDQVEAGFGLEFDIQLMKDGGFAISHDTHLGRISKNEKNICLAEITANELGLMRLPSGDRLCNLDELLNLLVNKGKSVSALHLKHNSQDIETLIKLTNILDPYIERLAGNFIIFDATPPAARYLKNTFPNLNLAASVSHAYDIARFGKFTGGTLLSPDEAINYRSLYSWVWLDEWDRSGPNNSSKSLLNSETVKRFRENDFKIAAVSPELHATSSALLGNELHEIGSNPEQLKQCWMEWNSFNLDALCTDHGSWLIKSLKD